jgi:predicted nucleic acid-binding Zn ribbon protein
MSRTRGKTETLGEVLRRLLNSWGVDGKVREQGAVCRWDQIVGDRIAAHTEAVRVEDGKVFVRIASSAWKTELIFMKADIIDRLNREVGKRVITDIVFIGGGSGPTTAMRRQKMN